MTRKLHVAALLACLSVLGGCSWIFGDPNEPRGGVSSSLVDYLYPKGEQPPQVDDAIPSLELPLRVGLAFVPASSGRGTTALPEADKVRLLDKVKAAFVDREYIEHIEVIPETYLKGNSGVSGMQQVARLYGVDVMALVSYDQVAVTDDKRASVLYWTIVGAYFISATENQVQTFVDTAVFDAPTAKLLFRAPGTDKRQAQSTAVASTATLREERAEGFAAAMAAMTRNLSSELDRFEDRLEEEPQLAEVQWQDGRGGAGSLGLVVLLMLLLIRRARA